MTLRGVDLGAWLYHETWISLIDYPFHGRVVVEGRDAVLDAFTAAWITEQDIATIAAFSVPYEQIQVDHDRTMWRWDFPVVEVDWRSPRFRSESVGEVERPSRMKSSLAQSTCPDSCTTDLRAADHGGFWGTTRTHGAPRATGSENGQRLYGE